MPRSQIDVCNEALGLVGSDAIASLDDGSAEGSQCARFYDGVLGEALLTPGGAPFRWSFATKQVRLNRLAPPPVARWAHAYQIPGDVLRLHAVTQDGVPIQYTVQGDAVLTDADDGTSPLYADYTFRPAEAAWPPDFAACVAAALGAKLALALSENTALAASIRDGIAWRGARTGDSQARTAPRLRATRLLAARHGGRGRW